MFEEEWIDVCGDSSEGQKTINAPVHISIVAHDDETPAGRINFTAYLEEWLYAGGDSSEEQNATDVPMLIRQGTGQVKRERSERDHGCTIDVAAVHRHERYSFQKYLNPGPCTSW